MSKVSSDNDEDNVAATPGGTAGADDNDDDTLPQHITHMPSRSMSSFRARLRAARDPTKDPGGGARGNAAVSLFRWETRGHFWSAVEKAGDPTADPNAAAVGWRGWLNTIYRTVAVGLKNTCTAVRLQPLVLIIPLLVCGICIGVGIGLEMKGAQDAEDRQKREASEVTALAADAFSSALRSSLGPLEQLAVWVAEQPGMAALGPAFAGVAAGLLGQQGASVGAMAIQELQLLPFGTVRAAYPEGSSSSGSSTLGVNLLSNPLLGGDAWRAINSTAAAMAGPIFLTQGPTFVTTPSMSGNDMALLALLPVFVPNVTFPDETWGNAAPGEVPYPPDCAVCYNATTGRKLWGLLSARVALGPLLANPQAGIARLPDADYRHSLTGANTTSGPYGGGQAPVLVSRSPRSPSSAAVAAAVAVPGTGSWRLEVSRQGDWRPTWEAPLVVMIVVVSVVLSAFLFSMLVMLKRHNMLLHAMLPNKVIRVLATGRQFYEHYECVTLLYADIVRYSNAADTSLPPWEVVALLNDLHNMYDSILAKHKLVKIRRSGEAFMAIGGCPTAEDPVTVAVRCATCAREMVLATAGFRSSAGQRVQIRIGLHSGPVVAAVVGSSNPRFSLFGDTVDISYFMESTSSIMAVHVSDTTAELLTIADDPLLVLQPRGVIDMKGRGPMLTSWLRIDLLAPAATFTERTATGQLGLAGNNGGRGAGGGGGGGEDTSVHGGGRLSKPTTTSSHIACTADLAVAARMGVTGGAPLIRKLSATGLARTLRALPDRYARRDQLAAAEQSMLGSFSLRLQGDAVDRFRDVMARASPLPWRRRSSDSLFGAPPPDIPGYGSPLDPQPAAAAAAASRATAAGPLKVKLSKAATEEGGSGGAGSDAARAATGGSTVISTTGSVAAEAAPVSEDVAVAAAAAPGAAAAPTEPSQAAAAAPLACNGMSEGTSSVTCEIEELNGTAAYSSGGGVAGGGSAGGSGAGSGCRSEDGGTEAAVVSPAGSSGSGVAGAGADGAVGECAAAHVTVEVPEAAAEEPYKLAARLSKRQLDVKSRT